ncbi:hypothetical protein M8C21_030184 [Ambrosia artemisiifolia]|uniref:Ubiquitin-like protease family profile domain-containing protein n=1 Tax=Ambrosia artemisiifolia TaxID=4212 RepID=A0AAD5G972_AMBAR|nr:hypothetical protein M8C21_030184 [Ambrosia artemisiifolia]
MSISNCNKLEGIEQQQSDVGVDHRTFTFIMDTDDFAFTEHLPQSDSDYSQPKQPIPDSVHEEDVNSSQLDLNPYQHQRLYQIPASTSSELPQMDDAFCRPSSDHCTGELEMVRTLMENEDVTTVVFYPDHMVYHDTYCTDCVLTFTSSCIKIEGSTLDDDDDDNTLSLQWGVQDILSIKSQLYGLVGMAMVTIHVLMEDTLQAENTESTSGNELKFVIIGTNWYGRQEAITSLNVKYKTLWSSMLESESEVFCEFLSAGTLLDPNGLTYNSNGVSVIQSNNTWDPANGDTLSSFTKYFPNFDQPFDDIIYPKGDVDAVSISKRDVDLLLPDTFVNDTVIDFYIKYLKNKIKPEDKHRFHFFNSFFFRKLADPEKGPLHASEGKAAFQRVRKWTRKVNLFEKDYVFIPVNYNYHWSLIVMCHLGEVATYKDDDVTKMTKVPCVLHMDSIRGSHSGLKDLIQSYLKEEWKGRRLQEASEDISSRFDNIRFISLELPQQPNSFDCGLFLLHYVELFLEQAPIYFNPFHLTKTVSFVEKMWENF